jgi:hypothetical protein
MLGCYFLERLGGSDSAYIAASGAAPLFRREQGSARKEGYRLETTV